jgi:hypothetical protein
VLEKQGVSHVTSGAELTELCPKVKELHLASNCLSQWHDMSKVLTALLHLTFLDLSHNSIRSVTFPSSPSSSLSSSLHVLVLNSTFISWSAVQTCLIACPCLQELHLNNSGYSNVTLDPSYSHSSLQRLHINNNHISHSTNLSDWSSVESLASLPDLSDLHMYGVPLGQEMSEREEILRYCPNACSSLAQQE